MARSLVLLLSILALGPACTPGDACLRHSDCDNGLVCSEGRCSAPPVEAPSDATAEGGDATVEAGDADALASDAADTSDAGDAGDAGDSADSTAGAGDADAAETAADTSSDSIVDALGDSFDTGP